MDMKYINPFVIAVQEVLGQFGITEVNQKEVTVKEEMIIEKEVTSFIGLVDGIQGNVAYAYSAETAKQLASTMMMGMPVEELNEMTKSALAELANMFAGNATPIMEMKGINMDVTPPSLVVGDDVYFILSFHEAVTVLLDTAIGEIEVNISLEL